MCLVKLSIFLLLWRLSERSSVPTWHKILAGLAMALTMTASLSLLLATITQCLPDTAQFWRNYEGSRHQCRDIDVVFNMDYTLGSLIVLTDFVFTFEPIFLVWQLQISKRQKVGLILLLLTGLV